MKKTKKSISMLLCLLLILTSAGTVWASNPLPEKNIKQAVGYLHSIQNSDGGFSSKTGRPSSRDLTSWAIMGLTAAGEDVTSNKWAPSGQNPVDFIRSCQDPLKETTDFARLLLSLTAAGQGSTYQGVDLAEKIGSFQQSSGQFAQLAGGEQGFINSHMWSVLALASAGYDIPNREKAKEWLINRQNEDGGFGWVEGTGSDSDDTGIALQALVTLGEAPENSAVVKKALEYLKTCQQEDGGFTCGDDWMGSNTNAASDSWVLQGLLAAGENPAGADWSVNGPNPVTHLLSLQSGNGSFDFSAGVSSSPVTMTAYALMALSEKPLPVNVDYHSKDTPVPANVPANNTVFSDLAANHWAYGPIINLVDTKVLSGYADGTFKPDNSVSRAEFTKILACALNLQEAKASKGFPDISANHWAYKYISMTAGQGYVSGMKDGTFNPDGKISGAELATMIVKALPAAEIQQIPQGPDWYSGYVARAEENGLLYPGFQPAASANRAQCAYSIVQLKNCLD